MAASEKTDRLLWVESERSAFGQLRKFKLDDGMSDSECDQPFVLSRVATVADD